MFYQWFKKIVWWYMNFKWRYNWKEIFYLSLRFSKNRARDAFLAWGTAAEINHVLISKLQIPVSIENYTSWHHWHTSSRHYGLSGSFRRFVLARRSQCSHSFYPRSVIRNARTTKSIRSYVWSHRHGGCKPRTRRCRMALVLSLVCIQTFNLCCFDRSQNRGFSP